jgi:ribosomal protein S18 acetylase RimI-like enzyme
VHRDEGSVDPSWSTDMLRSDPVIRRAEPADLPALVALQRAAYRPNTAILGVEPLPLLADYEEVFRESEIWLAVADGVVQGALILQRRADHLLIWSVAVAPEAQDGKLGRRFLALAEEEAARHGLKALRLYTGEQLTRNIDWYKRNGYAIERIEPLRDRRLVHMIKTLA